METYRKQLKEEGLDDETIDRKMDDVKYKRLTEPVGIDVAYDMGWQKKSSGRRYDSKTGHAFLIGLHTNSIIDVVMFCKDRAKYMKAQKRGEVPVPHCNCPRNYFESHRQWSRMVL